MAMNNENYTGARKEELIVFKNPIHPGKQGYQHREKEAGTQ